MFILALGLIISAGVGTAVQSPTNTALAQAAGSAWAAFISFSGGFLVLAFLTTLFGTGSLPLAAQAPWWQWIGGLYGVFMVIVVTYATPVLGVALTSATMMVGQLGMGALIDTFGLIGVAPIPLSPFRIAGILFVVTGVVLIYFSRLQTTDKTEKPPSQFNVRSFALLLLALAAGIAGAIQAPTNAALGRTIGSLEAALISFGGGVIAALAYALLTSRGQKPCFRGTRPWQFLGGLYGAYGVTVTILATPILGVAFTMAGMMLGQMSGGVVLDQGGYLGLPKISAHPFRIAGIMCIAVGIAVVALYRLLGQ